MTDPAYVLGHSAFELAQLARQERLIGHVTRAYLQAAGIGAGAVAFIAAELVGSSGEVIGIDLAPAAI